MKHEFLLFQVGLPEKGAKVIHACWIQSTGKESKSPSFGPSAKGAIALSVTLSGGAPFAS